MMNNLRELILFLMWDNFYTYVSMDIFLFYLPSLRDLVATCRFFFVLQRSKLGVVSTENSYFYSH